MARETFCDTPEDVTWLLETHLKNAEPAPKEFKSFIIYGNEDCPEHLRLYTDKNPDVIASYQAYTYDKENDKYILTREQKN
jgi:hypothetical protein